MHQSQDDRSARKRSRFGSTLGRDIRLTLMVLLMSATLSMNASLENATKYLTPVDRDQFFRWKSPVLQRRASKMRLHAFMWEVVESDAEDEEDE